MTRLYNWIRSQRDRITTLPVQQQAGADLVLTALSQELDLLRGGHGSTNGPRAPRQDSPVAADERTGWISVEQAAGLLGVHEDTVRRWARTGTIPAWRPSGGRNGRIYVQMNQQPTTMEEAPR